MNKFLNKYMRKQAGWSDGKAGDWIDQTLEFGNSTARGFLKSIPILGNLALKGMDAANNSMGNTGPSAGTKQATQTASNAGDITGKVAGTGLQLAAGGLGLFRGAKAGLSAVKAAQAGKGFLGTVKLAPQMARAGANWYLKQLPSTMRWLGFDTVANGVMGKIEDPNKGWLESFGSAAKDAFLNPINYVTYPAISGVVRPVSQAITKRLIPLGTGPNAGLIRQGAGNMLRGTLNIGADMGAFELLSNIGRKKNTGDQYYEDDQYPIEDYAYEGQQYYPNGYGMYPNTQVMNQPFIRN